MQPPFSFLSLSQLQLSALAIFIRISDILVNFVYIPSFYVEQKKLLFEYCKNIKDIV